MKKITVFSHVSIDGHFAGPKGEIEWFQSVHDDEWNRYAQERADFAAATLMFGHTTYKMMEAWWPTPAAKQMDPRMAEVMNGSPKIVFSRRLKHPREGPDWRNIRVFHHVDADEVQALKRHEDITILGSGTIVQQLTALGLIDEYSLVVVPVVLGRGKPLFKGVGKAKLRLVEERSFRNGVVLLRYQL